jgi:hypothetical protein
MHFLFSLLRINGFYMFRALLAHPQEALLKRHLVYCVRVISVGRLCNASWGWAINARNMSRPLILNELNRQCIMLVSLYWFFFPCLWTNTALSNFAAEAWNHATTELSLHDGGGLGSEQMTLVVFVVSCETAIRKLNVLLTVNHGISVQWNQRDTHFIQFIKN